MLQWGTSELKFLLYTWKARRHKYTVLVSSDRSTLFTNQKITWNFTVLKNVQKEKMKKEKKDSEKNAFIKECWSPWDPNLKLQAGSRDPTFKIWRGSRGPTLKLLGVLGPFSHLWDKSQCPGGTFTSCCFWKQNSWIFGKKTEN